MRTRLGVVTRRGRAALNTNIARLALRTRLRVEAVAVGQALAGSDAGLEERLADGGVAELDLAGLLEVQGAG